MGHMLAVGKRYLCNEMCSFVLKYIYLHKYVKSINHEHDNFVMIDSITKGTIQRIKQMLNKYNSNFANDVDPIKFCPLLEFYGYL